MKGKIHHIMKGKIHHIIKKNTLHVVQHIKKHKHHYMLGVFGSFAIIKTIGVLMGLLGFLTIKDSFANYNDGLIAYRPLDINTNDYSINSNNGSGFNIESSIGKVKSGYDFNGSNAYINIPNNTTFNTPNALTIQAWIKRDSDPSSGAKWASIVNKGGDNQYRLQHNSNNTGFEFAIRTVSGTAFVSSTTIPQQGIWYFLVGTYDGTTIKMYVNGILERSIGRTSPITSTISPVNIGRRATINDRYFDGSIDEVAIWNRALSSVEISGLYNGGAGNSLAPITTYTLTYTANSGGTISGTTSQTINEGENGTTITAIANSGYHFTQRSDSSTQNPRTDTNVTGNISVTAQFAINPITTYTLNYGSDTNGTISGTVSQTINEGENGTTVKAIANTGYHFTQWSDGSTTNPRTDTNITGNIMVTAQFTINSSTTYDNGLILYLPFDSDMNDYSPNNNHGVGVGEIVAVEGKVGGAYDFGGGEKYVSIADNETLKMVGSSYTLSAWIYITSEQSEAGIISKGMYPSSGPGYGFMIMGTNPAGISGNPPGNWFNSSYSIPISDWHLITVTFDASTNNHAIYVNGYFDIETVNGGIPPLDDSADLWIGNWREGSYDFEGYIDEVAIWNRTLSSNEIAGLYSDGNGISLLDNPPITYILTYAADTNGTISGTTSQTINEGSNGTAVTAIPNTGYHFTQRSDSSTQNPRTDTNITGNITVTAQFALNPITTYTLTYTADSNGTINGTASQTINEGSNGTAVTAIANSGYHFLQWSDGSTNNPRTDTNATGNISVTATFALNPINTYTLTYTTDSNGTINGTASQAINEGENGTMVTAIANTGYHFLQWSDGSTNNPRTDTNVTGNISVTAQFLAEERKKNGGGYQSIIKDNCPGGDNSISYYDNICDMKTITGTNIHGTAPIKKNTKTITRKTLARLLVFFSEEVLNIQPKENNTCTFEDIRNESIDNQLIIKKSCQLGLMGLQKDGLTVDHKFRGNDAVMYGEFITTISRLLYDKKNNISLNVATDGFANHIKALDNDNILVEIPERITQSVVINILKKIYKNPNMIKK